MHIVWVKRFRCRFIENFARNTFRNYAVSFLRQTMQLARPVFAASSLHMCRNCLIARFPTFRPSSSPSSSSVPTTRVVVLSPHNKCWTYDERWRYGGASQQLWFNILPSSSRSLGVWERVAHACRFLRRLFLFHLGQSPLPTGHYKGHRLHDKQSNLQRKATF